MTLNSFIDRIDSYGEAEALVTPQRSSSYRTLVKRLNCWRQRFREDGVAEGDCVAITSRVTLDTVTALLALFAENNVAIPLPEVNSEEQLDRLLREARAGWIYNERGQDCETCQTSGDAVCAERGPGGEHYLLDRLRERVEPGLILFSSGTTNASKAALLNVSRLLERYKEPRKPYRTLQFMGIDHIGGVNTMLHTFAHGGTIIVPEARTPDAVCAAIALNKVELLPTTPTFLNLLLMSGALARHDLGALKLITYGTECMPEATLAELARALPEIRLKQTYGSTELGILPTRSKSRESLLMQVDGDHCETRIVDGTLRVFAPSRMEGYLNADQPFDANGWYDTGDVAEESNGYLRIAGRKSEIINVGGEKVFPADVESVLLEMPGVRDAVVEGRHNPIVGQIVAARVVLSRKETLEAFEARMRSFCNDRLAAYKVPLAVELTDLPTSNVRFKRQRRKAWT